MKQEWIWEDILTFEGNQRKYFRLEWIVEVGLLSYVSTNKSVSMSWTSCCWKPAGSEHSEHSSGVHWPMGREVLRQILSNIFRYALYGMREQRVEEGNTTDCHLVHVFESELEVLPCPGLLCNVLLLSATTSMHNFFIKALYFQIVNSSAEGKCY